MTLPAEHYNRYGQALGIAVSAWQPRVAPNESLLQGRYCRLERLTSQHTESLYAAQQSATDARDWTYLPYGPFVSRAAYQHWLDSVSENTDPLFYAVVDEVSQRATGVLSLMRMDTANGVIEIGHIYFAPCLQRTRAATEAIYLLLRHVFDLGYRRCEWKCNALNQPSRRAAERLGFSFEGVFRQAAVVKGYNRDTAWYSLLDNEWALCDKALALWLSEDNFVAGQQRYGLQVLRARLATKV